MPSFLPSQLNPNFNPQNNPIDELILSYKENAQHFAQFLSALTPKKIFSFKSAKIPPSLAEKNIGLIIMTLIAAFVDPAIRLNNDKSTLFDKSWTTSVLPYFQNCGKVI